MDSRLTPCLESHSVVWCLIKNHTLCCTLHILKASILRISDLNLLWFGHAENEVHALVRLSL